MTLFILFSYWFICFRIKQIQDDYDRATASFEVHGRQSIGWIVFKAIENTLYILKFSEGFIHQPKNDGRRVSIYFLIIKPYLYLNTKKRHLLEIKANYITYVEVSQRTNNRQIKNVINWNFPLIRSQLQAFSYNRVFKQAWKTVHVISNFCLT